MIVEAVRVLNGSTLNTLNSVLLFVGLGLLAVGGVLLVMAVVAEEDTAALGTTAADERDQPGENGEPTTDPDPAAADESTSPAS